LYYIVLVVPFHSFTLALLCNKKAPWRSRGKDSVIYATVLFQEHVK